MKTEIHFYYGPFKIDYSRNFSKSGTREKVEFSGIEEMKIYDQNGKIIDKNTWRIVYDESLGSENDREKNDEDYKYPYPNQTFYIELDEEKNEEVTKISKIEIIHKELKAEAEYETMKGTYNRYIWEAKRKDDICDGGLNCPHGALKPHTVGHIYYLQAKLVESNIHSQDLLNVNWAKREYEYHTQILELNSKIDTDDTGNPDNPTDPDNPNNPTNPDDPDNPTNPDDKDELKLVMDFSGVVWDDNKETICDGIKVNEEKGVEGVKITVTPTIGSSLRPIRTTYTDKNGEYKIEQIRARKI